MLDYSEKRDYIRMTMACDMQLRYPDKGATEQVHLEDLSATGMRFYIDHELEPNSVLEATVTPCNDITPPMQAQITVLRCSPVDADRFEIAASIDAFEPAQYAQAESA